MSMRSETGQVTINHKAPRISVSGTHMLGDYRLCNASCVNDYHVVVVMMMMSTDRATLMTHLLKLLRVIYAESVRAHANNRICEGSLQQL